MVHPFHSSLISPHSSLLTVFTLITSHQPLTTVFHAK